MTEYNMTNSVHSCDIIKANKAPRDLAKPPNSYTWAQKMRSAITYTYGYEHGLGNLPFHLDPATQKWVGNPSISNVISNYMIALKRRKVCGAPDHLGAQTSSYPISFQVQAGEKPMSSRAFPMASHLKNCCLGLISAQRNYLRKCLTSIIHTGLY
jgi:hypothetical protein